MPILRVRGTGARFANGALLAFIAGVAISVIPDWLTQTLGLARGPGTPYIPIASLALSLFLAGAGAWVARSWWAAALVVPVAYFAGYLLGALLDLNLMGSAYDPGYLMLGIEVFAVIYLVPLLLVALLATAISKRLSRRVSAPAA